jgi:hypothetical protein
MRAGRADPDRLDLLGGEWLVVELLTGDLGVEGLVIGSLLMGVLVMGVDGGLMGMGTDRPGLGPTT